MARRLRCHRAPTSRYPYDDAKQTVRQSVAPLGADYSAKYQQFLSGKQIDAYENEGKRSGAYVGGVYGVVPYMLLNHNDTQSALFTLAHEGGHAMHTILSYEKQPFVTSGYNTIFVAEVASTTDERFLLNQLLQTTSDPQERTIGDLRGKLAKMVDAARQAWAQASEIVVLSEMSVTAYYPR